MKKFFLSLLIFIWIISGFFNVFFNSFKSISEIREWVPLSDYEKREKIFGELYPFLNFVEKNTLPESNILIFSSDIKTHYLAIYYLYPRITYDTYSEKELNDLTKKRKYTYIALFKEEKHISGYEKITTLTKDKKYVGTLYKKR